VGVGVEGFPELLQFLLELLLLLHFLVVVNLAAQLIGEDDLPLHLEPGDLFFHLMIFPF